jgi:hypothetical protein
LQAAGGDQRDHQRDHPAVTVVPESVWPESEQVGHKQTMNGEAEGGGLAQYLRETTSPWVNSPNP